MQINRGPGEQALGGQPAARVGGRDRSLVKRGVELARRAAKRPYATTLALLAANLVLIGVFAAAGRLIFGDTAEFFRELMPGTWLSFMQITAIAMIAWAIHTEVFPGAALRIDSLWGISVVVFAVFAIDEATQLTIFLADALGALGALAPAGFQDLDAFLLTVLLLAGGAALLRYGWALFAYPPALALLALGVAFGIGSQTLDALFAATTGEFVAEESLKLTAEPFLIGGYLVVLATMIRGGADAGRPQPSDRAAADG